MHAIATPPSTVFNWDALSALATLAATLAAIGIALATHMIDSRRRRAASLSALSLAGKIAKDAISFFEAIALQETGSTSSHRAKFIVGGAPMQELFQNMGEVRLMDLPTSSAIDAYSRVRSHVRSYEKKLEVLINTPGSAGRVGISEHLQGCIAAAAIIEAERKR